MRKGSQRINEGNRHKSRKAKKKEHHEIKVQSYDFNLIAKNK